ncbi:hypothetical protein TSUD_25670 [Trifolium subterraneum]|uniref:Reverse transcriptase domain-containing protein n=1 Tax=Trifolium subterraneum TaxID=3900 RepID=A0A2Z6NDY4_TRISU|nr:hypothetical protein TSUD_25670 [Trifolium subterraneum]
MGYDTCLFEEEKKAEESQTDYEEGCNDPEVCRNVDMLVDKIADELKENEDVIFQENRVEKFSNKLGNNLTAEGDGEAEAERPLIYVAQPVTLAGFNLDNNLIDFPLSGRKFTWFKGDGLSMSRLDRFLLSEEWYLAWPNCQQVARLRGLFDHCSLVLSANEEDWGPHPSKILKCPRDVPGYNVFVKYKWNSFRVDGWGGYVLKEKLKMIKKGKKEVLSEAEIAELHGVTSDIHSLSRMHASISWQQSRSMWLKEGDTNSKYFHSLLEGRRRGNAITVIQVDGARVDNLQFKKLNQIESCSLTIPFSEAEADLRGDVMRFIFEFHRNDKLTKGLNFTFIALIPKVVNPQRLNEFHPISLVGNLYKILTNRLRLVIDSVISESQTAFVKDRQILDGILIANEVVDEARKAKKELMLFKVDFEKAYDSVDWGYLDNVMGRMSFPTLWRKWIKECVCTITASVLVNGSPTDESPLERGLRQGDSLSLFLFLLAAEGLNVMMEAMVARNLFTGLVLVAGSNFGVTSSVYR